MTRIARYIDDPPPVLFLGAGRVYYLRGLFCLGGFVRCADHHADYRDRFGVSVITSEVWQIGGFFPSCSVLVHGRKAAGLPAQLYQVFYRVEQGGILLYEKWIKDWKTALAENFFLRSITLLLAIGLVLNGSFLKPTERIIVMPPQVTQQFWIEKNQASPGYLEQMAVFFATLGSNLSPANAEYNVKVLSEYISAAQYGSVKSDLASQALYIKKNNITQAFFPATIHVDPDTTTATVGGQVIRNIGTTKISQESIVIRMKFVLNNYKLWLEEYYTDYPNRKGQTDAK